MAKDVITGREADYSAWYNDIVKNANLAENSPVKGCMVIKPYGFGVWEKMKEQLDAKQKEAASWKAKYNIKTQEEAEAANRQ